MFVVPAMVASGVGTPVGGSTAPAPLSAPPTAFHSGPPTAVATIAPTPKVAPTPRKLDGPSGMTPGAKRPMAKEQIQIALTGERPLTHDELTSGFYQLLRRVEIEEEFTKELRQAVCHNADLVDHLGGRLGEVRAAVELLPTKHDQMVVGLQNNISEAVLNFDAQIRKEIDVVMFEVDKKLQEQFATMSQVVAALGDQAPAAQARPPHHDLARLSAQVVALQAEITTAKGKMGSIPDYTTMIQEQRDGNAAAVDSLRTEASTAHAALRAEASAAHAALRVELSAAVGAAVSARVVGNQSGPELQIPVNIATDPFTKQDPWQTGGVGAGGIGGQGNMNGPSPSAAAYAAPTSYDRNGRFVLYDEKVHASGKYAYDAKRPEVWLSDLRDYIAGRTRELDPLLLWLENCSDEVESDWAALAYPGCMDVLPPMEEVSRQLWSFLGPLVKDNSEKASAFRNVPMAADCRTH